MATVVSPTAQKPAHDITLTDGATTVGFVLTDASGKPNPQAITDSPQQRTAIKTSSGDSKYSDLQPPWGTWVQDDWSGGRGVEWVDDDKSRFSESEGVTTSKSGEVILGARPYISATQPWNTYVDYLVDRGACTEYACTGNLRYIAQKWVAPASMTEANSVTVFLEVVDQNATITLSLHVDTAGAPGAQVAGASKAQGINAYSKITPARMEMTFTFDAPVTITGGNTYWIKLTSGVDDVNWMMKGILSAPPPYPVAPYSISRSPDNVTWTPDLYYTPYRVTGNASHDSGIFLDYKGSLYYVIKPTTGAITVKMYLNGDRGVADSNVGALTTLVDATKTWTVNAWRFSVVKIIRGSGSQEERPWRYITANTATTLTVSEPWTIAHDTTTEYAIVDTGIWKEVLNLGGSWAVSICAVATDEFIYIGRGQTETVTRYQEYNNGGVWTQRTGQETRGGLGVYAQKMCAVASGNKTMLFVAENYFASSIYGQWAIGKYEVPSRWGSLIEKKKVQIAPTDQPWDAWSIANVTQIARDGNTRIDVAAALAIDTTNGTTVAVENLDSPVDLTTSNQVGFYIMSSTAVTANKIKLVMDDLPNLGKTVSPTACWHRAGTSSTYTSMAAAIDGESAMPYTITHLAADSIYIVSDRKFGRITVDIGATPNAAASTTAAYYFNGAVWTAVSGGANGTSSGGATFAVDGSITFTIPHDWEQYTVNGTTGYVIKLTTNANWTANVIINDITVRRQNLLTVPVDVALVANQWQWFTSALLFPTEEPAPNATIIQSIGLQLFEDNGDQNIYLRGGICGYANNTGIEIPNEKVTNLVSYAGNAAGVENCWVFTEKAIYEIQSESGDALVRLPIDELRQFGGPQNGRAVCVNDVYLWFNMGRRIEKYYLRNLDDVGPDKDEGLGPALRDALPVQMISYPGSVFLALNQKYSLTSVDTNGLFSSVLQHRGGGWHSFYRGPAYSTIGAIHHQRIADRPYGWLWIQEDTNVLRLMVSDKPYTYQTQKFISDGTLETGWIHCGMIDVPKTFGSIKVFGEFTADTDSTTCSIRLSYKLDSATTWTDASTSFTSMTNNVVALNVTGKRIKLRFRLVSSNANSLDSLGSSWDTPKMNAMLLEYFAAIPVKYNYGWTSALQEDFMSIDLTGKEQLVLGTYSRAETAYEQLKTWANAGTKLTQNSRISVYDNKTVILNAPSSQPIRVDSEEQREEILISVSTFDL